MEQTERVASAPAPSWVQRVLIGRNPRRTAVRIVIFLAVSFILFKFVLVPIRIQGISMFPSYKEGGVNCVNRLAYVFHGPKRGDVVAIRLRAGMHVMYMKRVVGLPGETVAFRRGTVLINGRPLLEPYLRDSCDWNLPAELLGPDEYFVVGDNRSMPADLHTKGRVERKYVIGKVLW